jgi:hypothetical protein
MIECVTFIYFPSALQEEHLGISRLCLDLPWQASRGMAIVKSEQEAWCVARGSVGIRKHSLFARIYGKLHYSCSSYVKHKYLFLNTISKSSDESCFKYNWLRVSFTPLLLVFCFSFVGTWVWTQGLVLARQALYYLSQASSSSMPFLYTVSLKKEWLNSQVGLFLMVQKGSYRDTFYKLPAKIQLALA